MKTLVIGTSHAANCFTAIKSSIGHTHIDADMAALGINAWKLILDRCTPVKTQDGLLLNESDLSLTPTHRKRYDSLNISLGKLRSYDVIIAVDFFFKGWQRVVDNFAAMNDDSPWNLNSADSSVFPASIALISALVEVSGSISGHGGPYAGEKMHTHGLTTLPFLKAIESCKRSDSQLLLYPAPMHPGVVTSSESYQSMTTFRSYICNSNGIDFKPQLPNTLSPNMATLPFYSRTEESAISDPLDMDGHMCADYWLMHVDHAGLRA